MEMFEDIIKHLEESEKLGRATVHNLRQVASYYSKLANEAQEKLITIKRKYNFNNRRNIFPDQANDTHLEFWRDSCAYNIAVSLADKTGVYDIDKELGVIIKEWTYENFLENEDDIEQQKYFKIADNLFYSWMSFNWQQVGGYETQLSVKIIENNSSSIFSLNDFAWYDLSNFITFGDSPEPRGRFFKRDLGLSEIYSRADLKFSFLKIPEYDRVLSKNGKLREISLRQGNIFVDNIKTGSRHSMDSYVDLKKLQVLYVNTINESIHSDWTDVTFERVGEA